MVSTYMRGAVIPISFSKVFLPPYHRDVDIQYPRFVVLSKPFWVLKAKEKITMISDVVFKNKMYYVLDERGKEISHNWDSSLGDLLGFSGTFMVFRKNKMYYSYDERCKEIAHNWESSLGEFRSVAGNSVNFRKNKMIYTMDKFFKEISHRWE